MVTRIESQPTPDTHVVKSKRERQNYMQLRYADIQERYAAIGDRALRSRDQAAERRLVREQKRGTRRDRSTIYRVA